MAKFVYANFTILYYIRPNLYSFGRMHVNVASTEMQPCNFNITCVVFTTLDVFCV